MLRYWWQHWHIENKDHRVRDVVSGEDRSLARSGVLPVVLSLLRVVVIARVWLAGMDGHTSRIKDIAWLGGMLLA
jgi:hypothetical protein